MFSFFFLLVYFIVKTFLRGQIRNCHFNPLDKPNCTHPSILSETKGEGDGFFFSLVVLVLEPPPLGLFWSPCDRLFLPQNPPSSWLYGKPK